MKLYTRPGDQGQIVEVSYGYAGDVAYQRCRDRSDNTETWYRGELDWSREPEGIDQDRVPAIIGEWERCGDPSEDTEEP